MIMRHVVPVGLLAGGVLACGAAGAAPQALQPGLWLETRKLTVLEGPGMSPQAMAAMRGRPPVTFRRCITAAEVQDGMKQIMSRDFHCPTDIHFGPGGAVDATALCHDRDGAAKLHFQGHYSPTAFNMTGDGVSTGAMTMKVHSEMTGHLVGPCR